MNKKIKIKTKIRGKKKEKKNLDLPLSSRESSFCKATTSTRSQENPSGRRGTVMPKSAAARARTERQNPKGALKAVKLEEELYYSPRRAKLTKTTTTSTNEDNFINFFSCEKKWKLSFEKFTTTTSKFCFSKKFFFKVKKSCCRR